MITINEEPGRVAPAEARGTATLEGASPEHTRPAGQVQASFIAADGEKCGPFAFTFPAPQNAADVLALLVPNSTNGVPLLYGLWTCADGREILFDRNYCPIWQRRPGQKVEAADPHERVRWKKEERLYNDGTPFEERKKIAEKVLRDWQVGRATPRDYRNILQKHIDALAKPEPFTITAAPYTFPPEASIPQHNWLLGRHLLRGEVSGSAAMGGTGKSSLSIVEALAIASGKHLTHDTVPSEPLRVVLINLEDKPNIMDKRIAAVMRHHGLRKEDIGDRLIVIGKGDIKFKIAKQLRTGDVERNQEVINELTRLVTKHKADVISIDSFIRTHKVNENDNSAIEEVIECFEEIAVGGNCAVHLWHHTRKSGGQGASVESARGAQAFIDACRSVRILETMSVEEAKKLKIANRRVHFRAFNGKLNFAPGTDQSDWYAIANVRIDNGPFHQNAFLLGDDVGVVEIWQHPGNAEADLTDANIEAIKQLVGGGEWREDVRAGMWVGKAIAQVLNLDPEDDAALVKKTIKRLIEMGALKREPGRDGRRKQVVFIVPCSSSAPVAVSK